MGLIAVLAGVVLLIVLIIALSRGIVLFLSRADMADGTPDPMFPQEDASAERSTRPPELLQDEPTDARTPQDRSADWVYEETSPVEKMPSELAGEALPQT